MGESERGWARVGEFGRGWPRVGKRARVDENGRVWASLDEHYIVEIAQTGLDYSED